MIDFKNKLLVKYSLEFIVIVVGISVTFWIDEWNRNRLEDIQHIKDINSIIDDLDFDSLTIDRVNSSLEVGDIKTRRIIELIEILSFELLILLSPINEERPLPKPFLFLKGFIMQHSQLVYLVLRIHQ